MALPDPLVVLDVETTGGHPLRDRITEIALFRIEAGEVVERWQQLINPGMAIPASIQAFTGITDAMVAEAPAFEAIAEALGIRLHGATFVAHNARFDFGFIKAAFERCHIRFAAPVLCTVKLSRALYPQEHRHGLDALIARHGLTCSARHRAQGDVEALWQFLCQVRDHFPDERLSAAVRKAMQAPTRPAGLPDGVLEGCPDSPGVYLFFGDNALPLYIGKSVRLRSRVMEHFGASVRDPREAALARQVRGVEWIETAGELGALLLEAALVRERKPLANRQLRSNDKVFALRLREGRRRPPVLEQVPIQGSDPRSWEGLHGAFRHRKEADSLLRELALLYGLCPRRLGLAAGGSGPCLDHQMKRCAGVCAGRESPESHDARLRAALAGKSLKPWPWEGPILVEETRPDGLRQAIHLLDAWCHLGSAEDEPGLNALLATPALPRFDYDTYRILVRWLDNPPPLARIRPLAPASRPALRPWPTPGAPPAPAQPDTRD